MASTGMRVDFEKSVVRSKMARGDVDTERLDNRLDVLECSPDCVAIERVAGHLIEACIFDWHACRRTCQRANGVTGAKAGPHRFESDASAGAYDEHFGHLRASPACSAKRMTKVILTRHGRGTGQNKNLGPGFSCRWPC